MFSITSSYNSNSPYVKEYGLDRKMMDLLALFVYKNNFVESKDILTVFNSFTKVTGIRFNNALEVSAVIEHLRKLSNVDRRELEIALKKDRLI